MKKITNRFVQILTVITAFLSLSANALNQQDILKSDWGELVKDPSLNTKVTTTILKQTFDGTEGDNWGYTTYGNAKRVSPFSSSSMPVNPGDDLNTSGACKLEGEGFIVMDTISGMSNYTVKCAFCVINVPKGATLKATVGYSGGNTKEIIMCNMKDGGSIETQYHTFEGSPVSIKIENTAEYVKDGSAFFAIKYVIAEAETYKYSLFTGTGEWNSSDNWSRGIPTGEQTALIQGNVTVSSNVSCDNVALGDGAAISVSNGCTLKVKNLDIYTNSPAINLNDTLNVSDKITIHKNFEKKGQWYLVSFPFDVYTENITSHTQGDDKTGTGDYFYAYTYDSDNRASSKEAKGNWTLCEIKNTGEVVFEKNKGYLVALDEGSSTSTLVVSSSGGMALTSTDAISVNIEDRSETDNAHYGWYLCGNPFFSSIGSSSLIANEKFDEGSIYYYDGSGFKKLDESTSLPFGSAFFVKTKGKTTINATQSGVSSSLIAISSVAYTKSAFAEPIVTSRSGNLATVRTTSSSIIVTDLLEDAVLKVYSKSGDVLINEKLSEKSDKTTFDFPKDSYLVVLKSTSKTQSIKVR